MFDEARIRTCRSMKSPAPLTEFISEAQQTSVSNFELWKKMLARQWKYST